MNAAYKKMKNLFLRQSYQDSWESYIRSLKESSFVKWDYIILTASNEAQAEIYRCQIKERLDSGLLPKATKYAVLSDPDGKRVGSGGATFNVLKYLAEDDAKKYGSHFSGKRVLVIHSGGDSKRVPQYSACGKLFSPVPRELPNGRPSSLFEELIIAMSGVPSRIPEGMVVLSGDVLLLFNPMQIDFSIEGAAAISVKEHVSIGKNHGVFLNDGNNFVGRFLHKQSEQSLRAGGAVNKQNCVNLDTGAIILSTRLLDELFSLISTENMTDKEKFARFVNERVRISFYGDFLYPLAKEATLEQYYAEAAEGMLCQELMDCRTLIWEKLHNYSMRLLCLSPAEFIHFGTTRELTELMTRGVESHKFLGWKNLVQTNYLSSAGCAIYNSLVNEKTVMEDRVYLENCMIGENCRIGSESVISSVILKNCVVPKGVVLHGLWLKNGKFTVRIYGIQDNPKGDFDSDASFLAGGLKDFIRNNRLDLSDLWGDDETYLWFAKFYPICDRVEEAMEWAWKIYQMASGQASEDIVEAWKKKERCSLYSSFNNADVKSMVRWQKNLENHIFVQCFVAELKKGTYFVEAFKVFGDAGMNEDEYKLLMKRAEEEDLALKIRIYYALSRHMKAYKKSFCGDTYLVLEEKCFKSIGRPIYEDVVSNIYRLGQIKIVKEQVDVRLPVRVNWGGGWTDTPPFCNENGGAVLNAALSLKGRLPIHVVVKRTEDFSVLFESTDFGMTERIHTASEIQNCNNPYDFFALHKAALIACGIVPIKGDFDLEEQLHKMGGGIYLSTQVEDIPKGTGLGTSSILSAACVKGIYELFGVELEDDDLYRIVLCMEQIMSTGGGWQDQVGGLTSGIKFITTNPGIHQEICVEHVCIPEKTMEELQQRFALIYTGQRRLARNLLRDVVGGYIGNKPEALKALKEMQKVAALMKLELENGELEEFGNLLNKHWELSVMLDDGFTNNCIDQIVLVCEDLIDAKFIAGAGGGGFLQVLLKEGGTKEELRNRLRSVFQDSGVDVWESEFV